MYKYGALIIAWVVALVASLGWEYFNNVVLCFPSYCCVTFGSWAFLMIGFKMYNLP
jgi:hypothetical protein